MTGYIKLSPEQVEARKKNREERLSMTASDYAKSRESQVVPMRYEMVPVFFAAFFLGMLADQLLRLI